MSGTDLVYAVGRQRLRVDEACDVSRMKIDGRAGRGAIPEQGVAGAGTGRPRGVPHDLVAVHVPSERVVEAGEIRWMQIDAGAA